MQRCGIHVFDLVTRLGAAMLVVWIAALSSVAQESQGFRLLMVEQPGCVYCRVFNRVIAPIYDVAPEGRAVPLVSVQLRAPAPEGVTLTSRPFATPTFILIGPDGVEVDRMVGYLGDDFFWPYLTRMFDRAGVSLSAASDR